MARAAGQCAQAFADLNELFGLTEDGQVINPDVREAEGKIGVLEDEVAALQAQIENNTELGFDNTEALARLREVRNELAALRAEAANLPRHVEGLRSDGSAIHGNMDTGTPFQFSDYEPPPSPVSSTPVSITDHPVTGGGTGGGGRGGRARKEQLDDYAKEVKAIRERTAALQVEAAVLVSVAASGQDYGDALEFARQKAELLHAAQQAGKTITPELEAEIDKLADAYVQAGLSAEEAADRIEEIEQASGRGKDRLEDMFGSIIDGSMFAKDAVAQLLMEISKVQAVKAIMGLPGMEGLATGVGNLLSFDGGGFTGYGARTGGLDGKGGFLAVMHPRERVIDETRATMARRDERASSVNMTIDLRGTTGDRELDAKLRLAGQHILEQARRRTPGWMAEHHSRAG